MKSDSSIRSNVIWRFLEKFSAKAVTLVVSIVLARMLDPAVYGTVALVTVFTAILEAFIDSGLGNALIQKKDADDLDFSSVFFFNLGMCILLYAGMFFSAPWIASFYEIPELIPIVRVMSLTLIISGVKNIQHAYISRNMMFRKFFWATLTGTIISAVVGLVMAYKGFGVWALVAQPLTNYTIDTIALWIAVDWHPKAVFSWHRLKGLLSYGWKLLAAKMLNTTYNKLRDLLIGKYYSASDLAFFNKGDAFPSVIVPNITQSVDGVIFPAMAARQDNVEQVRELVKKSTQVSSYVVFPMMAGLCACANPLICVLLTDKWLPSAPFMYIFCVVYAFYPLSIANLNSIRALGRSDTFLRLEIIEKIVSVLLLLISFKFGVLAMGISYLIGELFSSVIVTVPNKKLIDYGFLAQIKDLGSLMTGSIIMGIVVYLIQFLEMGSLLTLIVQIVSGIIIYLIMSVVFRYYGFLYFLKMAKSCLENRQV